MCKSPRLPSSSIHCDGAVSQSLFHESRNDHAVPARLARTHRIEKSDNADGQISAPMIRKSSELIDQLGSGIAPT